MGINYFSLFSGIGGFELGIERALGSQCTTPKSQSPVSNEAVSLRKRKALQELSRHGRRVGPELEKEPGVLSADFGRRRSVHSPVFTGLSVRREAQALQHDVANASGRHGRQPSARCVGFSEIDRHATQIYQHHFPNHKAYGDITNIAADTLPDFDLLVGGFPCQAFSIAGKRRGFDDTRGTLFFEIARLARAKRPRLLLLENVKGLLSHDGGNTFQVIIFTLDDLGYDLQWQVLNSKNHGVPQNRERVFIVGHLRGTPRPEVFPFEADCAVPHEAIGANERQSQAEVSHALRGPNLKADQLFIYERSPGISQTLKARADSGIDDKHPQALIGTLRTHKDGEGFRRMKSGVAPTLNGRARQDGSQ